MSSDFTNADLKSVSDHPEWSEAELKSAKPFAEILPKQADAIKKTRGRPQVPSPKIHVSLRLDPDVLGYFKSTGKGWQGRINDVLKRAIKHNAS